MRPFDASRTSHFELMGKADLCSGALTEASRLVARRIYGALLSQLLARACDILDEIDEVLIGLHSGS